MRLGKRNGAQKRGRNKFARAGNGAPPKAPYLAVVKLGAALRESEQLRQQQAATAEILKVIASSPAHVQPVFDTIARSAVRLCGALFSAVYRFDGEKLHFAAQHNWPRKALEFAMKSYPKRPDRGQGADRAILTRSVVRIEDVLRDSDYHRAVATGGGWRRVLAVPMMRGRTPLGTISVAWADPGPIPDQQVALLKTFADQAVIAIENARLFNETKEALEHQKASADILKIVASSVDDANPVFEAITRAGAHLVPDSRVALLLVREGQLHFGSYAGLSALRRAELAKFYPCPLDAATVAGTAALKKSVVHVPDLAKVMRQFPTSARMHAKTGSRGYVAVPLMSRGRALGAIAVTRDRPGAFSVRQVDLIKTFADQAVIAIENARLFNETKEALQHQAATSDVLRIVSRSMADAQPVFKAILDAAMRMFVDFDATVWEAQGDELVVLARGGKTLTAGLTQRVSILPGSPHAAVIHERRAVRLDDVAVAPGMSEESRAGLLKRGRRALLMVPLLKEGQAIGAISVSRTMPYAFSEKQLALLENFADQAAIAIENTRLFNETKEALEQQIGTAEILKVISRSPTDTQPVFDIIADRAVKLCDAEISVVSRFDGELIHLVASHGVNPKATEIMVKIFPMRPGDETVMARTIRSGALVHVADVLADPLYAAKDVAAAAQYRSSLGVPMMRGNEVIGAIFVGRSKVGLFSDKQVVLMQTFADQAVIAVENVRLFNETKEALERQTATAEILKVISASPTDVQPVLDAIVDAAARLFGRKSRIRIVEEGELRLRARSDHPDEADPADGPLAINRESTGGRVAVERIAMQIGDTHASDAPALAREFGEKGGYRAIAAAPLLREGAVVGVISVTSDRPGALPEKQMALLQTFADQAVIAIENVRLFNETKEALERQTAMSEVLRVISSTPADARPVFDAIAQSALRVFNVSHVGINVVEDGVIKIKATRGSRDPRGELAIPMDRNSTAGRAVLDGVLVQVADTEGPEAAPFTRDSGRIVGFRAVATAPMLREGMAIGSVSMMRAEPGRFTDKQLELLQSFADQAVIAVENARLFNETKEALERQTATAEILKAIAASPSDVQPVFDAIANSALQLLGGLSAVVTRVVDGMQHLAAFTTTGAAGDETLKKLFPARLGDLNSGVAITTRAPSIRTDTETDPTMQAAARENARARGYRSVIAVPMLRDGVAIGAISVSRRDPGPFSKHQIDLLMTFADQAVIAIENVRLFNETKEALERQTATGEILKVISSSTTDTQPTLDAIAATAHRLFGVAEAGIVLLRNGRIELAATCGLDPARVQAMRSSFPRQLGLDSTVNHVVEQGILVHLPDTESADVPAITRRNVAAIGVRAVLGVPMLREGNAIGGIFVSRLEPGRFSDKQVALLQTFADQAVIAIENVRLFNETKEALERQTATADILKAISGSTTDTRPVFDAIVESGCKLFPGATVIVALRDEDQVRLAAVGGANASSVKGRFPFPLGRDYMHGLAILDCTVVDIPDAQAYTAGPLMPGIRNFLVSGNRAQTVTPMVRGDAAIGAVSVTHEAPVKLTEKQLALLRTFADQAVIAIENVRLFNETREALEQQTAISDILRVISSSPSDVQPVLDAVAERAARICGAPYSDIILVEAGGMRVVAGHGDIARSPKDEILALDRTTVMGRSIVDRKSIHVANLLEQGDEFPRGRELALGFGHRTIVAVPLLRDDKALGTILVRRMEVRPFEEKEIALLKTFADQAVIAIQNARLFNETKEALEQQTATAEILKVISSSTTDTQPVFEAIVQSAARLFAPCMVVVVMREGDVLLRKARAGPRPPKADQGTVASIYPLPFDAERSIAARSVIERRIIEVPDTEAEGLPPIVKSLGRAAGYRAITLVPLVKEGEGIGVIGLSRPEPGFKLTDKQLTLVRTFADQAVIAIENVRLFKELQERTQALTKSVGQLTALGQVGQAITSTLDLETVLKTIVSHAVKLTGLDAGAVYEYDEQAEAFHLRAAENLGEEIIEVLRTRPIRKGDGVVGRTAVTREPMQIHDTQDESYQSNLRELVIRTGRRALLAVPLMREDHIVGALTVQRNTPGPFAPEVVELLKTFATQSAMAIQNARLYREIEEKSRELETASRHKSQFLASMSHELRTPLNAILGFNEMILDQVYGEVPPDVKSPLENIQSSGKHLLRLINNVLDLAKIEAGRMELALSDFSVQDTVASVHSTLRPLAAEKGLEFVAEVPADIPPAHGDAGRLAQCLLNLAGNSLKFTKEGRVAIAVARNDGLLRFSVADTGIGIPADKIPNLFTEFKQTDATIASEYGGTGLGLSITKKFIEMHGGRIWVESEPGKGSTFRFEIPLRAAQ